MSWIADRAATKEDADADGDVVAISLTDPSVFRFEKWELLEKGRPFIPFPGKPKKSETNSKEPIAEIQTYSSRDFTSTGYDITVFENYAILRYHTNWQGSKDGETYKAFPPAYVIEAAKREAAGIDHGHEPDLNAAVWQWLDSDDGDRWQLIRRGSVIR